MEETKEQEATEAQDVQTEGEASDEAAGGNAKTEDAPEAAADAADAPGEEAAAESAGEGEDSPAGAATEEGESKPEEKPSRVPKIKKDDKKQWYIVHTYSGYEQKVKLSLVKQLEKYRESKNKRHREIASYFGDILIPTENVVELVKGQRKTSTRKFFPGYILVQMESNDESRHFVRETPKVSGFVGGGTEPTPISEEELSRILKQQTEGAERPKPKVQFERGENIRVVHGPFANFTGVVEDVKPEKGKVKVLVTIFGRATPVELSFVEVEKT